MAMMKSVSGIRATVGDALTPDLVVQVASAASLYYRKGVIVVGRDGRCTGNAISDMLCATLRLYGRDVIDVGIVPTPTVQLAVEDYKAAGGIIVSASHNPIEWNAFKLIDRGGSFLGPESVKIFFELMEKRKPGAAWNKIGGYTRNTHASVMHIDRLLKLVDVKKIRAKKFRVALDSVNASGSSITQTLLEQLGCTIVPVYCNITGTFPRVAEPLPENLKALSAAVKKNKCDIGFAQDPDADRLAIVNELGKPIGEEYTLAIIAEHFLRGKKGAVVVNLSTSKAVEDIAVKHGNPFFRSKVGEINVVEMMKKKKAVFGGEGNGGVISPEAHLGRDSLAGIVYVLNILAAEKKSVSEIVGGLPQYTMVKGKVSGVKIAQNVLAKKIAATFPGEKTTDIDGIRVDFVNHAEFAGGWAHLRSSNTEPIFRIITEGRTKKQADAIYKACAEMLQAK